MFGWVVNTGLQICAKDYVSVGAREIECVKLIKAFPSIN